MQPQTPNSCPRQLSAKNSSKSFFADNKIDEEKKFSGTCEEIFTHVKVLTPESAVKCYGEFLNEFQLKEIKRFKHIYYVRKKLQGVTENFSNADGHYLILIGDSICYRYEILEVIGSGSFGQVVKCLDHKTDELVAIKILKRTHTSKKQGLNEYRMLSLLNSSSQVSCTVEVKRKFEFRFHFFIVLELLGYSLRDFINLNKMQSLPITLVKRVTSQLLLALSHMHSQQIIHCDLKPDNIAFKSSNKSSIRVFDFGSSCLENNTIFTYIQSRYYRAPEIVLQCGKYTTAIDMWSLGCIVAEMLSGEPLFRGKNEEQLMKNMVKILGSPSEELTNKAKAKNLLENCKPCNNLRNIFSRFGPEVIEFLEGCLNWSPSKRLTAKEGIKVNWFLNAQSRKTLNSKKVKSGRL